MDDINSLICPICNGNNFQIKYEATYIYSYNIDSDAPGLKNTTEFLPYLYDSRIQTEARQYLQCGTCHAKYPCYFTDWDGEISSKRLQDAINSNFNV
jgi:hypothetical protein